MYFAQITKLRKEVFLQIKAFSNLLRPKVDAARIPVERDRKALAILPFKSGTLFPVTPQNVTAFFLSHPREKNLLGNLQRLVIIVNFLSLYLDEARQVAKEGLRKLSGTPAPISFFSERDRSSVVLSILESDLAFETLKYCIIYECIYLKINEGTHIQFMAAASYFLAHFLLLSNDLKYETGRISTQPGRMASQAEIRFAINLRKCLKVANATVV